MLKSARIDIPPPERALPRKKRKLERVLWGHHKTSIEEITRWMVEQSITARIIDTHSQLLSLVVVGRVEEVDRIVEFVRGGCVKVVQEQQIPT